MTSWTADRTQQRIALTLAIWGVLTLLIISTPPYARADGLTGVRLPGTLEFDMVVDDAHHQVFESSGPDGSGVAVLGFDGSLIQTIALKGASGLALSDGDLYVAASSAGEIDVVDTVTLSVVRAIPLDGWTQPGDLHLSPGLVWFFGQPPRPTTISLLASVRSDGTGAPRAASGPIGGTSPRFVDGAGGRGFIYMFDLAAHPYVLRFPIVGSNIGEQFGQDSSTLPGGYGGSADAAFVPGRNTILMATGRTKPPGDEPADAVTEVSTQSLAGVMTYPVPGVPRAVAATGARGGLLAATTWSGSGFPGLSVFRPGDPNAVWFSPIPVADHVLHPVWSDDGRTLFLVGERAIAGGTSVISQFLVVHPFTAPLATAGLQVPPWELLLMLSLAAGLGVLVALGAKSKGYGNAWAWWAFGFLAFVVALIVLIFLPRKPRAAPDLDARSAIGPTESARPTPPPIPPPPPLPAGRSRPL